ncbi:hypothetical protein ACWXWU_09230 [Shewanella sp. A14]
MKQLQTLSPLQRVESTHDSTGNLSSPLNRQPQAMYWQLLHNNKQLINLYQANSIAQFVALMAQYLQWPNLNVEQMLAFIAGQQSDFTPDLARFSQCWMPNRYDKTSKTVSWLPAFCSLTKPFLEDSLSDANRSLLATFIKPVTLFKPLLAQRESVPEVSPDLMIFHWSRCGSTLVSGSFAQLDNCLVLSEPVFCSEVIHDTDWPEVLKPQLVDLCLRLQGQFRQQNRDCQRNSAVNSSSIVHSSSASADVINKLVVKWNAWDLAFWPMLLALYPKSRVLCLMREPQAILASHSRLLGRHMVQAAHLISPKWHDDVLLMALTKPTQEQYSLGVLMHLAQLTQDLLQTGRVILLDYQYLQKQKPVSLATLLAWPLQEYELERWRVHWQFDAKHQGQAFKPADINQPVTIHPSSKAMWHALLNHHKQLLTLSSVGDR